MPQVRAWAAQAGASAAEVDGLLPNGATGMELCRTSEAEMLRRLEGGRAGLGKRLHAELWTLICDAKVPRCVSTRMCLCARVCCLSVLTPTHALS
jgi:hypothetical protein